MLRMALRALQIVSGLDHHRVLVVGVGRQRRVKFEKRLWRGVPQKARALNQFVVRRYAHASSSKPPGIIADGAPIGSSITGAGEGAGGLE